MRRSRCSTCASASSFSRSWRAIRRSTASPVTRNSPAPVALDGERAPRGRAEDLELGHLVLARRPSGRARPAARAEQRAAQVVEAGAGGGRRDDTGHVPRRRRRATRRRPAAAAASLPRARGRPWRARARAAAGEPRVVLGQLALDHRVVARPGRSRRAARGRARARAAGCARRARGSRGRGRRRRSRPRSGPGCRRPRAGGRRASSVPSTGSSVVNGYAATFGCARVSRASSDDLPALGSPTRPTSASSLRCSSTRPSSPGRPFSASRGVCRTDDLKRRVAAAARAAARDRDLLAGPHEVVAAYRPSARPACPGAPRPRAGRRRRRGAASRTRVRRARRGSAPRRRNDCRSRSESSQRSTTSPPRPPSPPSGPPLGTCASRRNDSEPLPPAPARTSSWARSVNTRR